jgi:hypothetical protein
MTRSPSSEATAVYDGLRFLGTYRRTPRGSFEVKGLGGVVLAQAVTTEERAVAIIRGNAARAAGRL